MNSLRKLLLSALAACVGLTLFAAPASATAYGPWRVLFSGTPTSLEQFSDGGNFYPTTSAMSSEYKVTFAGRGIAQSVGFSFVACYTPATKWGPHRGNGDGKSFSNVRLPATYYLVVPAHLGICQLEASFGASAAASYRITISGRTA